MNEEKYAKAKRFLKRAKKLDRIISNKMAEKAQWLEMAKGMTSFSAGERVQSSGSQQKMADSIDKYIDIDQEINEYIDSLIDTKREITRVIEQLNEAEYDFLHKVYIQNLEIYEMAIEYDRSYSWAKSTHHRALRNVQRILEEEERAKKG